MKKGRVMALKSFQTDKQLWFQTSFILFVAAWCMPFRWITVTEGNQIFGHTSAWSLWLLPGFFPTPIILAILAYYTLIFGILAAVFGFVIHCIIVMVRDYKKKV